MGVGGGVGDIYYLFTGLHYCHYNIHDITAIQTMFFCFQSMTNFMMDPLGDLPWDEDSTATSVAHLDNRQVSQHYLNICIYVLVIFAIIFLQSYSRISTN